MNKTVPLSKDIGCSSTFLESLGIADTRTDLDTVLTAIDLALSTEIDIRSFQIESINVRMDEHIASTTAHEAINLVNSPTGNLSATTVQGALDELQSDIDIRATQVDHLAEVAARESGDSSLQAQVDGERSPLRMSVSGTTVHVAGSRSIRKSESGELSALVVPNGSMLAKFDGADIDFSAGVITYSDASTEAFDRIDFSGNASRFAKYAIILLPGEPNTILVIPGSSIADAAIDAEEPAFSGGVPIGFVTVQDDGTAGIGTIQQILPSGLAQAVAVGSDSSGNEASPLDPNTDELFVYYTRSDFSLENKTFFGSTTGIDQISGLKKVVLDSGEEFISGILSGPQFKSDGASIDSAQARLLYNVGKVDKSATVQMSRDGGETWASASVYLPGSDAAAGYQGDVVVAEASFESSPLAELGSPDSGSTEAKKVAIIFSLPFDSTITGLSAQAYATGTSGTVRAALYSVGFGIPQAVMAESQDAYVVGIGIDGTPATRTFSIAPFSAQADVQYALVLEAVASDGDVGVVQTTSPSARNISSATNSGFGWTASGATLSGGLLGSGADLVLKIVSGTDGSELIGFGVNYCTSSAEPFPNEAYLEESIQNLGSRVYDLEGSVATLEGADLITRVGTIEARAGAFTSRIVGSAADVAVGAADYASIGDAILNVVDGGKIVILPGQYSESITVDKKVFLEGLGHGTVISGAMTIQAAATGSMLKFMRFAENVTIDANANNINLTDCWVASGKSITNNGTNNLILAIGE